jgi:hypothetical protein
VRIRLDVALQPPDRSMVIAALMDSADVDRTYRVLVDLARVIAP